MTRPLASLAAAATLTAPVLATLGMAASSAAAADAAHPVVVELFQSQGCSSCPPANANVAALADRPGVLALSFGVTYWDSLGWKDTFATPQYTARQWDYAHGFHHDNVFTPQVVINGHRDGVGVDKAELRRLLIAGDRGDGGPAVSIRPGAVTVGRAPARGSADVWLVRYDPRVVEVPIKRGENGGRTLPHKDIVRELIRLGRWSGAAATYALPKAADPAFRTAVLVQAPGGGPILAAARS
ncbi:MAG: DUF1223 domain-containing protein [Pseudomonadota bacterium]|nr:DUF1223 domain-containing protein [Pseudomonadota bacterium]